MAPRDRWDQIYADCFKDQPEGHALYKDVSVEKLKPGTCGFFDEQGDWQIIADLIEPDDTQNEIYSSASGIERSEGSGKTQWLLRKSASMYRVEPQVTAGAGAPAIPVQVGGTAAYKTSSGRGAILVTDGNIVHSQATPAYKMCEWLKKNGKKIVEKNPDAKDKGVWLVTKTYSAKRRRLALLMSKSEEVTIGIDARADEVGRVEATTNWWKSQVGGTWISHDADTAVVLAMDGIYWKDHWYSPTIKPVTVARKQKFLGGDFGDAILSPVDFAVQERDDTKTFTVELVPEIMGSVDGIRVPDPDQESEQEGKEETDDDDDDDDDDEVI